MERECSFADMKKYVKVQSVTSKNPAVSALQDLLFYLIVGISFFVKNISPYKQNDSEINDKITRFLYLTNKGINFSVSAMMEAIFEAYKIKNKLESLYKLLSENNNQKLKKYPFFAELKPGENLSQMVSQANIINIQKTLASSDFGTNSLKEIIRLSISSSANYLERIKNEDKIPQEIYALLYDILSFLGNESVTAKTVITYTLKAGELHAQILERVINSFEKTFGLIERRKVTTSYKKGSAILVVGEDFGFLQQILKETENKDINIYTYGILNYAHVFPEINKYKNLAGIYVGKYNNFSLDIEYFPGVVILTSGNLTELREIFRGRVFSTEDISILGVTKIKKNYIKPLINAAYDAPGFLENKENCYIELGFGIKELENLSLELYSMLKDNKIDNAITLLGCNDSDIYKQLTINYEKVALILLDSCESGSDIGVQKRYNIGRFVNLYSFMRLLYSLAGKFKKDVNNIPIKFVLSLNDSESVAALLLLLASGIKNIMIHSELSRYLTEAILKNFSKEYNLKKITDINDNTSKKQA